MAQPVKPTPIPPLPLDRVPQLGTDTFDEDALIFTDWEATKLAPGINAAATNVYDNAKTVFEQGAAAMAATGTAQQRAEAAAAQAAQHAASASQASRARSWTAGQAWQINDVVWGQSTPGVLYRCIAAHSGQTTAPEADAAHWVSIGARLALDPLAGATRATFERDAQGRIVKVTSLVDGKQQVDEFQRDGQGLIVKAVTRFDGKPRTESYARESGSGRVQNMTSEVV